MALDAQRGGPLLAGTLLADSSSGPVPLDTWLRGALSDPDRLLVVGTLDELVFGFGVARIDRHRRQPVVVIDMLRVEAEARGVGVGEAMLARIVAWATELGAAGIDAPALPGSREAKAFFEDSGFTARLLVMHHALPASGG